MHQTITEIYFLLYYLWKYHSNTLHDIVYPGEYFSNYEYTHQCWKDQGPVRTYEPITEYPSVIL